MFFFKQMTAYEMRISDWSSDVCSSDLESCQGVEIIDKLFLIARRAVENRPLSRLGFTLVEQPQLEQQFLTLWSQRGCGQAIAQRRPFHVLGQLLPGHDLRKHGPGPIAPDAHSPIAPYLGRRAINPIIVLNFLEDLPMSRLGPIFLVHYVQPPFSDPVI